MRKPGKSSRERNADFCSNHNDDEDKYFFKVLVGDFRERLVIPDKFEQHFRGLIANSAKLESHCGYTFDVEVAKNLGKVVLQTGWKEFVTAHGLNMGDLLVFKYDGTSRFKVFIFDLSCREKMPPCHVKRNHIRGRERREELPVKSPGSKREAWKQREGNMNVIPSSSTSPSDTSGDSIYPEDQKLHCQGHILPRETRLTCVQMKKLKERVRANSSTIPIYGCIITKSNIHGKMAMVSLETLFLDWSSIAVMFHFESMLLKNRHFPAL
ncbi:putative B3 domain-containing protein Os03g0621600 isoform X1 [Miscanthus floridulus]|uniref:putative B3 domain-containing protein Os03g0621600 isoform X1 n=1 Tax=Miscanthus floridulus TaxID=154761 RepID=UPI00345790BE